MNILQKIILFDFQLKTKRPVLRSFFLITLLILCFGGMIYFSFNHDWKRWVAFLFFILGIKFSFDLALLVVNRLKKSEFKLSDLVFYSNFKVNSYTKRARYLLGFVLIVLFSLLGTLLFLSFRFLDKDLKQNGVYTTATVESIQYQEYRKKKHNSGYYLYYSYTIDNSKIVHRTKLQSKRMPTSIQVNYLTYLPNKHTVKLIYR